MNQVKIVNRNESDIKKEDINERKILLSLVILYLMKMLTLSINQNVHDNFEKCSVDNNNIINTFVNDNGNKSPENHPHSSKNLNKIKKEGKYILYKYNLIIDKNNLMEGFGRKTESKRKNKEDYEKKCPKESGEEGDHIKDYREKMISDFMEKKERDCQPGWKIKEK